MEAGPVSAKKKGFSRIVFQTVSGFDFKGGHLSEQGTAPDGQLIDVPLYKHQVSLDFNRLEFEYDYTFKHNWDLWFRLPYEIKGRAASIDLVEPASAAEQAAMERNKAIHHDRRTLTGLSDFRLLVAHRKLNLLREGDGLDIAFGTSLPTGATEENPFKAGDAGLEHEHIQFGTGTFDPLIELYYTAPVSSSFTLGAFGVGRFPLYENSKNYEGPTEVTSGVNLLYGVNSRVILQSSLTGYYQDYAHWDDDRDINSGLRSLNGRIGATFITRRGTALNVAVRQPIAQETLDEKGDTFEQGPSLLFYVSHSFRPKVVKPRRRQ